MTKLFGAMSRRMEAFGSHQWFLQTYVLSQIVDVVTHRR